MTLKININEQYVSAFITYLKTLKYISNVEILPEKTQKESTVEGFRRAAKDSEMFELAESGLDDFLKLTELWNNETSVLLILIQQKGGNNRAFVLSSLL